ncbi:B12-binding domain-containing protein [Hyphomonas sp.]|uniref:cobalamin B12-binding domain-containing protein n=1 Tax=Hyphomonas sp. TaxID=87 RepID=UPI00391AC655
MGSSRPAIDHELYRRAASLFAHKREVLDAGTVELLASDIVRRLSRHVKSGETVSDAIINPASIGAFCDTLVHDDPVAALQFIEDRRAEGLTRKDVYLGYIGAAATMLGERWDTDQLSFIDVTFATGHLYALMRSLRDEGADAPASFDGRKRALFATVPGEDHGIGITIAADIFRQAGWEIDLQIGTDHNSLAVHVEQTTPRVMGFSLSTERRLGDLMRLVVAMRVILPDALIGLALGAGIDRDKLSNLADIDLIFKDPQSALTDLDRMIRIGT